MADQFGKGWCADASGRQFDSWHGPFIKLDWCKAFCSRDPKCLGFDYIAKPNHCELRFGGGHLPAANPGPFWHKYENGQAVGPIAQVIADGTERMCYRKNLGRSQEEGDVVDALVSRAVEREGRSQEEGYVVDALVSKAGGREGRSQEEGDVLDAATGKKGRKLRAA
jgi:hypothetical protein